MNTIVLKLGLSIMLLFLIVLFPIGFVVNQTFTNFYVQKEMQELLDQSEKLKSFLQYDNDIQAANNLMVGMQMANNSAFILDAQGRVVTSVKHADSIPFQVLSETDWETLRNGGVIQRGWPQHSVDYMLVANPILFDDRFAGVVYLSESTAELQNSLAQLRGILLLLAAGALFISLGFTTLMVRRVSLPLLDMERATRKIAKGNLETRVKATTSDEIGSLAGAINNLAADLKRYRDTRNEFFANISHELRTPLTYLEGYFGLIKEQPEKHDEIYEIITQETTRLRLLINDLFDLSQLEEGKISLLPEWIDFGEVVDSALEKVKHRAEQKGILVEFQESEVPLLHLDGNRMHQVLLNLLDNAIRYTRNGRICVKLELQGESVSLQITDTGIGIPEEELPLIFERFHRVEKSRSRETGGTGLGLAIVKKLVELQGGNIEVTSRVGVGTTFDISFPIEVEEGEA